MDVFRQLTRGIRFNTKKFHEESVKFGLASKEVKKDVEKEVLVSLDEDTQFESREPSEDEEGSEDGVNEFEQAELTLLGDVKVKAITKSMKRDKQKKLSREKKQKLHVEKINRFRNVHRIHVSGTDIPEVGW